MPDIHFWFSGTALFLAASFLFGIVIGLVSLREMLGPRTYHLFWAAAVLLTFFAWRTAAVQEADSAETNRKLGVLNSKMNSASGDHDSMSESLGRIAVAVGVPKGQPPTQLADKIVGHIDQLQTSFLQSQRKLADAQEQLAKRQQTTTARLDAMARQIKPSQLNAFIKASSLTKLRKVFISIVSDASCPDCESYANDLENMLTSGGWMALREGIIAGPSWKSPRGLAIAVPKGRDVPMEIAALVNALDAARIPYDLIPSDTNAEQVTQIILYIMAPSGK